MKKKKFLKAKLDAIILSLLDDFDNDVEDLMEHIAESIQVRKDISNGKNDDELTMYVKVLARLKERFNVRRTEDIARRFLPERSD